MDFSFYDNGLETDYNRSTFTSEQNIFLQTEEGRMFPYSPDSTNYYQYYLTDHLGNTRVAFDTPHDTLRVEQQDDYLPFGMEISKLGIGNPKNEYLYNKKELQENTQLYDYGARFYDPVMARWTTIDPLAEISRKWSPYNYVENDPVRNTDPDGMEVIYDGDNVTYKGDDAVNFAKGQQAYAAKTAINGLHALGFSGPGDGGKGNKKRPALDGSDTKIQPITGWFWRALDYFEGGRDVNGFNYDADGNPRGVAPITGIIKLPFGPGSFSSAASIIKETRTILESEQLLQQAYSVGKGAQLIIDGRIIIVEPEAPISGMTLFGEKAFVLGKEAFSSKEELTKTILQELYRLQNSANTATDAFKATQETKSAAGFAEHIYNSFFK